MSLMNVDAHHPTQVVIMPRGAQGSTNDIHGAAPRLKNKGEPLQEGVVRIGREGLGRYGNAVERPPGGRVP